MIQTRIVNDSLTEIYTWGGGGKHLPYRKLPDQFPHVRDEENTRRQRQH